MRDSIRSYRCLWTVSAIFNRKQKNSSSCSYIFSLHVGRPNCQECFTLSGCCILAPMRHFRAVINDNNKKQILNISKYCIKWKKNLTTGSRTYGQCNHSHSQRILRCLHTNCSFSFPGATGTFRLHNSDFKFFNRIDTITIQIIVFYLVGRLLIYQSW